MQNQFLVPERADVTPDNQVIFDALEQKIGFIPNLYATIAHSDTALGNYLQLQQGKTSLNNKEKEVVNLVVSEVNSCIYCQSAHTAIAKLNGFTDDQILELRGGTASFDPKLDALAKLTKSVSQNRGHAEDEILTNFFNAGYSKGNLIDVVVAIADKIVMNYVYKLTNIPIDFPLAKELTAEV